MKKNKLSLTISDTDYWKVKPPFKLGESVWRQGLREPHFAFVGQEGNNLTAKTVLEFCRESLCELLRQDLRGLSHNGIDTNKLRLLAWRRVSSNKKTLQANLTVFKKQIAAAQKMINTIEKHYGWPLTKVYSPTLTNGRSFNSAFYYIVASKRWMKAPAMLSLYTLLFRIGVSEKRFKFRSRVRSLKSLINVLEDMSQKSSYTEARYINVHLQSWLLVLKNYDKLFGKRNMNSLYDPPGGEYCFQEGINSLCNLDTKDIELREAFTKIVEKADA